MTCQITDLYHYWRSSQKIFLKLIYARIYQHLVDNTMFVDEPYGFRINSSTVKAAHKLFNVILDT